MLFSTPKTAKGYRRVAISSDVTAVLEEHRQRQQLEREVTGDAWPGSDLLFTSEVGTPYSPDNVKRLRYQLMDKARVPRVRLHDLRHLHVSLLVKRGLDAKLIAGLLSRWMYTRTCLKSSARRQRWA
jgi:integrase